MRQMNRRGFLWSVFSSTQHKERKFHWHFGLTLVIIWNCLNPERRRNEHTQKCFPSGTHWHGGLSKNTQSAGELSPGQISREVYPWLVWTSTRCSIFWSYPESSVIVSIASPWQQTSFDLVLGPVFILARDHASALSSSLTLRHQTWPAIQMVFYLWAIRSMMKPPRSSMPMATFFSKSLRTRSISLTQDSIKSINSTAA